MFSSGVKLKLTSLLFSIQLLTISGVSSSVTTFFSLPMVQAGPLLTGPMLGPKSGSLDFLSFALGLALSRWTLFCCWAMAVATCDVFVPVLARYGV